MFHNQLLHYISLLPARTDANITGINYAVQIDLERCLISFRITLRLCKEPCVVVAGPQCDLVRWPLTFSSGFVVFIILPLSQGTGSIVVPR